MLAHPYAQTFPQLLNQLQSELSTDQLRVVVAAYALAMKLFSGAFRASGKTFVAHALGTASIVARHRPETDLIAAALLHAAYTHGDFGWRRPGDSRNRRIVRQAVGEAIEDLIERYSRLKWKSETVQQAASKVAGLDESGRRVLFVRLCNELEEHLDLGIVYCGEAKQREYRNHKESSVPSIARNLGYEELARELEEAMQQTASARIAPVLCNPAGQPATAFLPSASFRRTWTAGAVGWARRIRQMI